MELGPPNSFFPLGPGTKACCSFLRSCCIHLLSQALAFGKTQGKCSFSLLSPLPLLSLSLSYLALALNYTTLCLYFALAILFIYIHLLTCSPFFPHARWRSLCNSYRDVERDNFFLPSCSRASLSRCKLPSLSSPLRDAEECTSRLQVRSTRGPGNSLYYRQKTGSCARIARISG